MQTNNKDLGAAFDKLKNPEYSLKRLGLTDTLTLTKNGNPVLIIPEDLKEDFITILSKAAALDQLGKPKATVSDIPAELFFKPGSNDPEFETM